MEEEARPTIRLQRLSDVTFAEAFVGFLKELRAFFLCKQWRTRKLWVGVGRRYD